MDLLEGPSRLRGCDEGGDLDDGHGSDDQFASAGATPALDLQGGSLDPRW